MGIPYYHIHIVMRVTIDPIVDAVAFDEIFQFHDEGSVRLTISKHRTLHPE